MSLSISEKYASPALAVVTTVIVLAVARKKWSSRRSPYLPGPKGYPIIGNLFDYPKNPMWEGFARMAKEYGEAMSLLYNRLLVSLVERSDVWWFADTDILHFNTMGSHMLVLSDPDVVLDLLERRSVVYSDRVCKHLVTPFKPLMLTGTSTSLGCLW